MRFHIAYDNYAKEMLWLRQFNREKTRSQDTLKWCVKMIKSLPDSRRGACRSFFENKIISVGLSGAKDLSVKTGNNPIMDGIRRLSCLSVRTS